MQRWTVGDVVIDLDAREVSRSGRAVSLSPKAFQLLAILLANRPKAVSKRELQEQLWPETFVVEKNLTNLVSEIRTALGDSPARPHLIRTVPRFGYAFVHASTGATDPPDVAASMVVDLGEPRRHNLPEALTSFVGRDRELADLSVRLGSTRLLTLTGAGGCGKTRLALELARRMVATFDDGVWLVELAALSGSAPIVQRVASTLELREQPGPPLIDVVANYLRSRRLALILDNCEHVIAPCAQLVNALLSAAPQLTIIATSRETLGVDGETVWAVPPLSLPELSEGIALDALDQYEAVRLFLTRAAAVDSSFSITRTNAAAVIDVCRQLDGIPLALELAAARLKVLSIDQIRDRLTDRFTLLARTSYTSVARQRTLEASVDWSYALLSDTERTLLRRSSVFAGGWTIEAAEQVCAGEGIDRHEVLALLSRLVEKSLVIVENDKDEGRRYRYLETICEYARQRLRDSDEAQGLADRHLAAYIDFARRAEPELARRDQIRWLKRLDAEHDNLRAALEWSLSRPEHASHGLELAAALVSFWIMRGYFSEGQRWLERGLAATTPAAALHAKAVTGLGTLTFFQGDLARACRLFEEGTARGRGSGHLDVAANALGMHALVCLELGDLTSGSRLAAEALAAAHGSAALEAHGPALSFLAYQALADGDADESARLQEQLLALARSAGHTWGIAMVLYDLGLVRVVQRRPQEARALGAEAIALSLEFGDHRGAAWILGVFAGVEAAEERPRRAAVLLGSMEALSDSVGAPVQPTFTRWIVDQYFDDVRRRLGASGYQQALDQGRAMSLRNAVSYALERTALGL